MRYILRLVLVLILLIGVDVTLAQKADQEVRLTYANLDARLSNAALDFYGPRRQACVLKRIYWLYVYQTCFFLQRGGTYLYVYHKPRPFVLLYGQTENAYYFQESVLGERLATIRDGVVVQERLHAQEQ